LLKSANELLSFSLEEEKRLEGMIKDIAESGVKVIVTGSGVGDLAMHFVNRYGLMVVKVLSKFDLRRLCKVIGASAMTRMVSIL
jgi:T-complex protein 1 subunit theta